VAVCGEGPGLGAGHFNYHRLSDRRCSDEQ
jgi:hypothetical protein